MDKNADFIFEFVCLQEGDKVTDKKGDHGGLTAKYGVTLGTMKELGIDLNHDGKVDAQDVALVDKAEARRVFDIFWKKINAGSLPGGVDLVAADIAWNSGPKKLREFVNGGYGGPAERLLLRRLRFYQYQRDNVAGQAQWYHGWENRVMSCFAAIDKCVK